MVFALATASQTPLLTLSLSLSIAPKIANFTPWYDIFRILVTNGH